MPEPAALRAGLYARVSTDQQDADGQMDRLRGFAVARGYRVEDQYKDAGVSGTKTSRPEFDRMLKEAKHRKFDVVIVERLDRLGRSLKHLLLTIEELEHVGVKLVSMHEGLDLSSPVGRLQVQLLGALAEFERGLIVERVKAGLETARKKGKRIGRLPVDVDMQKARELLRGGLSRTKTARALGIGKATLFRRLRDEEKRTETVPGA